MELIMYRYVYIKYTRILYNVHACVDRFALKYWRLYILKATNQNTLEVLLHLCVVHLYVIIVKFFIIEQILNSQAFDKPYPLTW